MRSIRRPLASLATPRSLAVFAAVTVGLAACGPSDGGDAAPPPAAPEAGADGAAPPSPGPVTPESPEPAGVRVWFKLDKRLVSGAYLGDVWVSPPTFQAAAQVAPQFTVEARVSGTADAAATTWTASEPDMVVASPDRGIGAVVTVHRAGRSTLTVTDGSTSTILTVVATNDGGMWLVEFSR